MQDTRLQRVCNAAVYDTAAPNAEVPGPRLLLPRFPQFPDTRTRTFKECMVEVLVYDISGRI